MNEQDTNRYGTESVNVAAALTLYGFEVVGVAEGSDGSIVFMFDDPHKEVLQRSKQIRVGAAPPVQPVDLFASVSAMRDMLYAALDARDRARRLEASTNDQEGEVQAGAGHPTREGAPGPDVAPHRATAAPSPAAAEPVSEPG